MAVIFFVICVLSLSFLFYFHHFNYIPPPCKRCWCYQQSKVFIMLLWG